MKCPYRASAQIFTAKRTIHFFVVVFFLFKHKLTKVELKKVKKKFFFCRHRPFFQCIVLSFLHMDKLFLLFTFQYCFFFFILFSSLHLINITTSRLPNEISIVLYTSVVNLGLFSIRLYSCYVCSVGHIVHIRNTPMVHRDQFHADKVNRKMHEIGISAVPSGLFFCVFNFNSSNRIFLLILIAGTDATAASIQCCCFFFFVFIPFKH